MTSHAGLRRVGSGPWWRLGVVACLTLSSDVFAVPTSWQLLDDGDPSPTIAPVAYDEARHRLMVIGIGVTTGDGTNWSPMHWELVGEDWVRRFVPEPAPRKHASACATYDSARAVTVLFGAGDANDETWEFNGTAWTKRSTANHPAGRINCAMAYDPVEQETVLFGGYSTAFVGLGDTWAWNGMTWSQVTGSPSPPARAFAPLVYDAERQRITLFGGERNLVKFGDTWQFDTRRGRWSQKLPATSPPARGGLALGYDPIRKRVVVFGGLTTTTLLNDTWEWNGTTWTQVFPATSPSPRWDMRFAYDSVRGKLIGYGGGPSGYTSNETWTYDGTTWEHVAQSGLPEGRRLFGMTYDPVIGGLVMYGGGTSAIPPPNSFSDTWHYVGGTWQRDMTAGVPSALQAFTLTWDPIGSSARGYSGWAASGFAENSDVHSYAGLPLAWQSDSSCCPDRRAEHVWAYSAEADGIVMFGGKARDASGSQYVAGDTWIRQGGAWTPVSSPSSPPPSWASTAAYDSARARLVLYGGAIESSPGATAQTWEFFSNQWSLVANSSPPGPRSFASMVYDASRGVTVLFGGGPMNEGVTWEFDGTSWSARPTPVQPESARIYFQMAYDPAKEVAYLFGGSYDVSSIFVNDTWAYGADPDGDGKVGKLDNCPAVANASQVNADGDVAGDVCDCAPSDPGSFAIPAEVTGLLLFGGNFATLTWDAPIEQAGSGAHYDVVTGSLSVLRAGGSFNGATCLAQQLTEPTTVDNRPTPAGDGFWYLARSRNVCGVGTYGRSVLDGSSPCP